MRKIKLLLVVFTTLILIVSCKPPTTSNFPCELPKLSTPPAPSQNLEVAVYLDGTPSMAGYVSTNTKSRYAQTLELLDSTFSLSSSKVAYQRLGTNTQEISREQYKQDAQSPNFYCCKSSQYPALSFSQIEKAIAPQAQDNKLIVIVTDLYQKDTDVTKVSKEIKKNYLNAEQKEKGYSVGIIAIKSEFNGAVYTETTPPKFTYSTAGKQPEEYHPFYLIFLGKYSDIDNYFNKLTGKLPEDSKYVIFSPQYLLQEVSHFQDTKTQLPNELDINTPLSLNNSKLVIDKNERLQLLEIGKKEKQDISLNYDVSFKSYKHTLLFKDTALIPQIDNSSLGKAFEVTDFKLQEKTNQEEQGLSFTTKIKPSEINPNIYLLTVDAIAKDLQEQQWWNEWSSTDANLTDGSKTYNLAQFLGQLKTLTTDVMNNGDAQAIVGRFCFAIEKK
jgi:hypothetical protein